MTIFSLYIFDRHCECIYYQDWHRTRPLRAPPPSNFKPGVLRLPNGSTSISNQGANTGGSNMVPGSGDGNGSVPPPARESIFSRLSGSLGEVLPNASLSSMNGSGTGIAMGGGSGGGMKPKSGPKGLAFDEESKLVYGVVLSLKNMVKKLSGKEEAFTSFRTSQYKLHLYETVTGYTFILLSDPHTDSLRFVLRQIHVGPFIEHVVRNPLVQIDSREVGIDNDLFRAAVDRHMRGLSMFGT